MNVYQWRYNLFPNDLMHKKGKKMKIKYSKSNVWVKTRFLFHTRRQKTVELILHARLRKAEDVFSIKNIVLLPLIATFHPIASKRISSSLEEIPG